MGEKHFIEQDTDIPEGLEYKDEYLRTALSMYDRAKKILFWKRFSVSFSVLMIVALAGWFLFIKMPNQNREETSSITDSQGQQTTAWLKIPDSKPNGNIAENALSNLTIPESQELETDLILPSDLNQGGNKNIGLTNKAFDHSDLGSSGLESRDRRSIEINDASDLLIKDVALPQENNATKSNIQNEVSGDHQSFQDPILTNENLEFSAMMTESPVENLSSVNKLDAVQEDASGHIAYLDWNTLNTPLLNGPKVIPAIKWKRWIPYLQIGINPISAYGGSFKSIKIDPNISAGVGYKLHHSFALSLEGRYYQVSGLSHPYTVESTTYGQGYDTRRLTYYTESLHYGGMGLACGKVFSARHQLRIGYAFDILISGKNRIETFNESSLEDSKLISIETKGYVEGFSAINHSMSITYQYSIGRNKSVGVTYQNGLTDITRNIYFHKGEMDRNSFINVYLRMNLTK